MKEEGVASAADLRREFDEQFQRPVSLEEEREEFLALGAGGGLFAVRTAESGGVFRCPHITRVPSPSSTLLGICGIRGSLVAAYDLAGLLGSPTGASGRWMILCGPDRTVGLVFDELQGCHRLPVRDIRSAEESGSGAGETVRIAGESRRTIRIPALLAMIEGWTRAAGPEKE